MTEAERHEAGPCCETGHDTAIPAIHRVECIVTYHWFMHIKKVLEAMEITSDTTRIRLAVF